MVIGLTGGIASGKSLVTRYLRELGIPVIDTDEIARQIVAPGQPVWRSLYAQFGPEYFHPDGQLDRTALAQLVFHDDVARHQLESIPHPAVFAEVEHQLAQLRTKTPPPKLIVVVVPLLFETSSESRYDATVLVKVPEEVQSRRLQETRGYTREHALARIAAQLPLGEKERRADYIIENSATPEQLQKQVLHLINTLRRHGD